MSDNNRGNSQTSITPQYETCNGPSTQEHEVDIDQYANCFDSSKPATPDGDSDDHQ